jgi:hypothetical protein
MTVAILTMVGAAVGISRQLQRDIPGALFDMPQQADLGGFHYDPASNLFAYCAVTAAICQWLPQPLREMQHLSLD